MKTVSIEILTIKIPDRMLPSKNRLDTKIFRVHWFFTRALRYSNIVKKLTNVL